MAENSITGVGRTMEELLRNIIKKSTDSFARFHEELMEKEMRGDPDRFDGFYSQITKDMQTFTDPSIVYLTRAWLIEHGWVPTKDIPLFQHDINCIDPDLCVVANRKEYIIAKFHHMGDDAWKPDAQPSDIEVMGINNSVDMCDISFSRLLMAVCICDIGFIEDIKQAIGGEYEIITNLKNAKKEGVVAQ